MTLPCPYFDLRGVCEQGRNAPAECRGDCPGNDERDRIADESPAQERARRALWQEVTDGEDPLPLA